MGQDPMNARIKLAFLALILAQAAHSVEEYVFRLYDVWAPARFVCSLVSNDIATGFVISNAALVLFGLGCYLVPVRIGHRSARVWVWIWIIIELINGTGHSVIALARGAYFPGVATAPLLLGLSIYLAVKVWHFQSADRAVA
jgi:uncharacterized protein with HXXEE motif